MTKKVLSILLVITMIFELCACQNTAKEEGPVFPETLTDEEITIDEGVPTIPFNGKWKKVEDPDGEDYVSLALYVNEGSAMPHKAIGIYTWEKDEPSLMDETISSKEADYPNQKELDIYESDYWNEKGDFKYTYYCAFDDTTFDEYTYCQAFFFESGNTIYEIDYYMPTEAFDFGDTGIKFYGPKVTEEYEDPIEDCDASRNATYRYTEGNVLEFCGFDLYTFDKGEDTLETITQWFYDTKDKVISVEPYTFTSRLGNQYEGIYVTYEDTYNGVKYYNATAVELIGDKFIVVDCNTPLEGMDMYTMVSASAMSYAIIGY